jgi:apolipoprotein N-acyltransferase
VLAVAAGVALGAAFLPAPVGFLAWFAFIPFLIALERRVDGPAPLRRAFVLGLLFGFAFYLCGTHWIALLSDVAITVPWLKYPAWVAAGAYLALYAGAAAWLAVALARAARVPLALTFPVAWVVLEELRGSGEMGFPWFQPGYTQHAYAPVVQLASVGGIMLVTVWVLAVNVLVWRALTGRSRARAAIGALLVFAFPFAWGQRVLDTAPRDVGPVVALVQGNVPGEIKWSGRHQPEVLATFLGLTERAAAQSPRPTIVIWPETATGSYLRRQLDQALAVVALASRTGVPVFSGYADADFGPDGRARARNSAGMFRPNGQVGEIYAKRHLVPFGERMPFQWLIPGLGKLELGQAEWTPGDRPVLFESAAGPFACLVCFEAIFPDLARDDVRRGARWLVNITNDEWFGNGAALHQHAAMAVFRCAENRVPMARCANTGLTVIIDAYGRITARLPVFRAEVLVAPLPKPGPPAPFTRWGDWPGAAAALAALALVVRALARRRV